MNDSAASWLRWAGFPPRGDELRGTSRHLPLAGSALSRNPWTSLNPCLPYKSRGHLLLAIIPLLLFCCYRFYHSKYCFPFKANPVEEGGDTDCWRKKKSEGRWWRKQRQSHSGGKPKHILLRSLRIFFIVYYCCCCCLIPASSYTHSPFLKHPSLCERIILLLSLQFGTVLPCFCFIFLRK